MSVAAAATALLLDPPSPRGAGAGRGAFVDSRRRPKTTARRIELVHKSPRRNESFKMLEDGLENLADHERESDPIEFDRMALDQAKPEQHPWIDDTRRCGNRTSK